MQSNIIPTTRKRRDREEEENTPSTSLTSSSSSNTISSYYEEKPNLIEHDQQHSPSSREGGTLTKLARVQADTVHICRQANSMEECMDSLLQGVTLPTSDDDNNELDAFSAFNDFMKSKHFLPSVLSLEHSVSLPFHSLSIQSHSSNSLPTR